MWQGNNSREKVSSRLAWNINAWNTERPEGNSASASNTSRPIHLPAPYCLCETSPVHSHTLLVDLQHEKRLPCCWSRRDDSFLLSACGCPWIARAPHARWGSRGGCGKWVETLWSLKRTDTARKMSTPHASIRTLSRTPKYILEDDFWAQKHPYMLHNIQAAVQGATACFPTPSFPPSQSCIPTTLPTQGCTLLNQLTCQLGEKKPVDVIPKSSVKWW